MNISNNWQDFECLATGNGEKLERWGNIILNRPDPSIIWDKTNNPIWSTWDGYYKRSNLGGGEWTFRKKLPETGDCRKENQEAHTARLAGNH